MHKSLGVDNVQHGNEITTNTLLQVYILGDPIIPEKNYPHYN